MYKAMQGNQILRLADQAIIPFANGNKDYQQYLEDVANGAEVLLADPLPPEPEWGSFNQGLLAIEGYKTWAKQIKKSNADDELYYQNLVISVGIQNAVQAQIAYDAIVDKPSQPVRDAANVLAETYNIPLTF